MNWDRRKVGLVRHVRVSCVQNNDGLMQVLLNVIISALLLNKVLTTIRYALTRETSFRMDGQTGHTGVTWRLIYSDFVPT